jgi:hypothetical protein
VWRLVNGSRRQRRPIEDSILSRYPSPTKLFQMERSATSFVVHSKEVVYRPHRFDGWADNRSAEPAHVLG